MDIKKHYTNVAELGCVLCGQTNPQLHHVSGGSVKDAGYHSGMGKLGVSNYWVIPLHRHYHVGDKGIHKLGVITWEERYSPQMELLEWVWRNVGYRLDLEGNEL